MKVRVRWYCMAKAPVSLRRLAEAMQRQQYSRRQRCGFSLTEVRKDHLSGSFIERREWDEPVKDPAGEEIVIHRVDVLTLNFRIGSMAPEVEILDAPRTLQKFVEALGACTGELVRLAEVVVRPDEWLRQIEARVGKSIVTSLTASGMALSPQTSASVALNGTEDVRRHLRQLTTGKPVGLERMTATLPTAEPARIELGRSGRATVLEGGASTVDLMRQALQEVQRERTG